MTQFRVTLCLLLTLVALVAGNPVGISQGGHTPSVLADEDKDESGNDEDKNEQEGKDDDKNDEKGRVETAAAYRVEVECNYDEGTNETICTFTGVAPSGAKDVSHVDLPASEVCTDVLGGEHEYVDPDPNTRVVGYKSRGSEGTFTLELDGRVTTDGTATYWFKTGDGVFPASGPGLRCGEEARQEPVNVTAEDTNEATGEDTAVATGAVLVRTYGCTVASPPAEYDWYGACEPGVTPVRFSLKELEGDQLVPVGESATDADGQVRFGDLAPGAYHLEAIDAGWCHAESDNVDEQGDLVVTGGAEVNVWTFFCGETPK